MKRVQSAKYLGCKINMSVPKGVDRMAEELNAKLPPRFHAHGQVLPFRTLLSRSLSY